jgi:hypothetical protein
VFENQRNRPPYTTYFLLDNRFDLIPHKSSLVGRPDKQARWMWRSQAGPILAFGEKKIADEDLG